jgi:hypothetical protein
VPVALLTSRQDAIIRDSLPHLNVGCLVIVSGSTSKIDEAL